MGGLQLQAPWEEDVTTEHSFQTVTRVSMRTFSRLEERKNKAWGAEHEQGEFTLSLAQS